MKCAIIFIVIAGLTKAETCAKGWTFNPNTGKCYYIRLGFDLNHDQCAARCHALHARLPCINGPQDEKFFPEVYPMPLEYPAVRSVHIARTHIGADKNENFSWGEGCSSTYTNWAPFYMYQPEWHCVTIEYNLQNTDWITLNCNKVTDGIRALCVCEGSVGEDLLLPAGDFVNPPPYCPSSYFVRNPENNKCYTDRTSQAQQGFPCTNICAAWESHRPDLLDPLIGTFLEQNFPGYSKYPNQSYASRCFCERDASYVYFPDPAPGMEQPGDVYPPPPAPFSCPINYIMDPTSAQCVRDSSHPADPAEPAGPTTNPTKPTDPTDDTDSTDPAKPAGPATPTDDTSHATYDLVVSLPVVIGVVVIVVLLVVMLLIAVVCYTRRSHLNVSEYQRVPQTIPMLPLRQPRRPQQEFQATVQATVLNPTAII